MNNHDQERIAHLLKESLPPIGTRVGAELRRDLWPAMLKRLEGFEVAVTELPQHVGWLFQHWHLLPFYIHLRRRGGEGYRDLSVLPPPRK